MTLQEAEMLTRAAQARTNLLLRSPRCRASAYGVVDGHSRCAVASPVGSADHVVSSRASEPPSA